MSHTPGPWKVVVLDGETYINPERNSGEYALLAKIHSNHKQREANAHLIAAAPEMLGFLKVVVLWIDELHLQGKIEGAIAIRVGIEAVVTQASGRMPCHQSGSNG